MQGDTPGSGMSFAVLGPLDVRRDGRPIEVGGQRLRALLTLLLLDAGRTVSTEALVAGVWDDRPPSGVGNALQALVSRLRATVGRDLVAGGPSGYRLAVSPDQVDLHLFARLAREGAAALAAGDPGRAAGLLREALGLWRGAPLTDLPYAEVEVARLEELRQAATEDRIEAELALGRHAGLVSELRLLVTAHPLRERPYGQLMRALYGAGRRVEALAAYEEARSVFADRLGADPSPALAELHLAMLRGEPAGEETRPPPGLTPASQELLGVAQAPPRAARRGNLRARLTSFVGRDGDVGRIGALLAADRLVTLLGPGGAGKTRLAVESAEAIAARVPGGVWLVELAPVSGATEVAQAALTALGLRDTGLVPVRAVPAMPGGPGGGEADPVARLVAALSARDTLIVLDNCEHVVEQAAVLADRLLAECPGLRILATSREPLGITGERLWPVGPLDADHAVRLFAERAAAVRPGYLVDGERDAVERICRELDGMPLAIELAAARLRTLSAGQVADRLGDRFRLLTAGSRTAMPRHQTLRAVVEWSWDLLDAGERVLAARLAVFAGGATLEAAEQVCEGDVDVLGRLVDKSLVVFDGGRYRMLATIKAYAAERLAESGDERTVRLAHAEFFARLAETAEPHLRGAEQIEWLARLSAEHDNLSAALRWACEEAEADLALRLVGGLGWYWWLSGHRLEGAQRSAEVLAIAGDDADPARLALAHAVHGITSAGGEGNLAQAGRSLAATVRYAREARAAHPLVTIAVPVMSMFTGLHEEAESRLEPLLRHPDPWVAASGRIFRANLHFNSGRTGEGEADLVLALDQFRTIGDRWGVGNCLSVLAETNAMRGDLQAAVPVMEEAIALLEEVGSVEETPYLRTRLAVTLNATGDRRAAEEVLRETERLCDATGDPIGMAGVRHVRGDLARAGGDLDAARRHYDEAVRLLSSTWTIPQFQATLTTSLGLLAEQEGDVAAARALHDKALTIAVESNDAPVIGHVLVGHAALAARDGDHARAAVILGGADAVRGFVHGLSVDHRRVADAVRAALGPEEFARCRERGRAMSRDEVLAFASAGP
ncbi:BTAD domain-containing putative transcriptional regulator [Microbispora hainanensis]|uniref:Tetratricopeptide repeat protein n=1 Tax=Microbispora hainanensis TaxID=568844 RepID=A0A544YLA7_9ACTN|nr:BTAD domain-containing putative transcriptional regulator [Microbispora hainanensis]TQS17550.1 tetratricopeptide repeat protein [Microbispora hainanensis]